MNSSVPAKPRRYATLDEWLAWFETLHPKKIDFSLDRIGKVLATLDIDKPDYTVISVAGTNGKGSCVALLESIYREAGYRVGAFTSPHLVRFNERIRVNGEDASDAALIELFERVDAALGDVTLSYFESSAVAAILCFARSNVDVAILEVGMGGRLDAVNALDADAALIVSVDLDHMDWLGPDREAIGREKAGIVRQGRPVVVADLDPPASVIEAIETAGARGTFAGRDYSTEVDGDMFVLHMDGVAGGGGINCQGGDNDEPARAGDSWQPAAQLRLPTPVFGGPLQIGNAAACAAVVLSLAARLPVEPDAISRGIRAARIPGRIDVRTIDGVQWVFDVAHNAAAAAWLAAVLERMSPARPTTVAVFGAMSDKQLAAVVEPFIGLVSVWNVAPVDSERSATAAELSELLVQHGADDVTTHPDVAAATRAAREGSPRRVLVFGSFYTVGPAMETLELYSDLPSAGDPNAWIQG